MTKHLIRYSTRAIDPKAPLLEISSREYWKKRLDYKKWRLHQTMGRPILLLRKEPEDD